jgi:NitT/TauT family transport system substrate-binding protein
MKKSKRFFFEKKKQKTFIIWSVILAAFAASPAKADDTIKLMTDWTAYGAHGPLFLAVQKGWTKEAGLDVAILDGKGSTTTIQLIAAGTVDVGFVQLATMAAAMDQGIDLTSLDCFIRAGDNGILVSEDSPIKEPKDLLGKRIVYPLGGASASLMEAFFHDAHLPRDDLHLVGVDGSALASTYVAGGVDAAVTTIAYLMPMVAGKRPSRAISYASIGLVVPSFGLAVRAGDVKTRAAIFGKLVPIMDRAWQYTKDGHVSEAIDAIVAGRPNERLDREVMTNQLVDYLKLLDTPATAGHPIGWQAEADWTTALGAMKSAGLIKHDRPVGDYFTNQFIQ